MPLEGLGNTLTDARPFYVYFFGKKSPGERKIDVVRY